MPTDDPEDPRGRDDEPEYRVYRTGRDSGRRDARQTADEPRRARAEPPRGAPARGADAPYTLYRSKPRSLRERLRGEDAGLDELGGRAAGGGGAGGGGRRLLGLRRRGRGDGTRRPITVRRVLLWLALVVVGWLLVSLVLFLVSAQLERAKIPSQAKAALKPAGYPLWSTNNVLLLGLDTRPKSSKEPGAAASGTRSDTIMLWRVGGGHSARLSIPRDTVVPIPGHGSDKINAAYAYGGAALTIKTIEQYLGIPINHLVIVSFENFPKLIDALGGVDVTTGRVCSDISGGVKNGGQTLRLGKGTHHLSGAQALVLARTRHNSCNPSESDLTRVKRQQQILSAMRGQLTSPLTFFRLPWVSWYAPKAMQTDMGGPTLLGFFGATATSGTPPVRLLTPDGSTTTASGGAGLTVSDAAKRRAVAGFLR
ncbi:MAG: cell envelope-related transcriptional attenuator [Conexibacter sp.]|nr:cell envelope-related transcriptional attenuator [Conexibacter sp.]